MNKSGELKVLHIDEDRYLKSPHGKIACRKCHIQVSKLPPGESTFDCTSECHFDDKEEITAIDLSSYKSHKGEKYSITTLHNESSCRVCHPVYPHTEKNLAGAFINMHAGFMLCEVCHLKKITQGRFKICGNCHIKRGENLVYGWKSPEGVEFSEEPYGRYFKSEKEKGIIQKTKNLISRISGIFSSQENGTKKKQQTEYSISRLAVFSIDKNKKRLLMNTRDTEKAIVFKAREKSLSPAAKKRRIKYFHRDTARMNISVACNECHSSNSILDFKKLGFDKARANMLKYLNIKGLVIKYETFYFPEFLHVK